MVVVVRLQMVLILYFRLLHLSAVVLEDRVTQTAILVVLVVVAVMVLRLVVLVQQVKVLRVVMVVLVQAEVVQATHTAQVAVVEHQPLVQMQQVRVQVMAAQEFLFQLLAVQ